MSTFNSPADKGAALEAITVDQHEAERLTGLSSKTLERRADEGEPVGRIKIGRRVLYLRAELERWLRTKMPTSTP